PVLTITETRQLFVKAQVSRLHTCKALLAVGTRGFPWDCRQTHERGHWWQRPAKRTPMNTAPESPGQIQRAARLLSCCALGVLALGQAGCMTAIGEWLHNGFKVGPNYQPPPAPLPPTWIDTGNPRVAIGEPNLAAWWDVFGDPVLSRLIQAAYSQNLTVRQAAIQILQAQIQRNIACSELLPQAQTLLAQYTHGEGSRNFGVPPSPGAPVTTGLSPSTVVGPLAPPSTPIAGATPFTPAGTTTTGTSPLINAVAGGGG